MPNEVLQYIRQIRNPEKKDYATRYATWLARDEDDRNIVVEPQPFHLSAMAAQAVRNRLYELGVTNGH